MSREESAHDAVQALIPDDTIIDEHDVSVELEAKRLGNLGVKGIIELLTSG